MDRDTIIRSRDGAIPRLTIYRGSMRPVCALLLALFLCSCRDPRAEANIAEAMMQVGTEMSALRQDYAVLQNQVDSLRGVVARQDTLLTHLAAAANVPLPPK